MNIREADAHKTMCPWNDFKGCYGSRCMAWQYQGNSHERCETNNLVETDDGPRPSGEPPHPGEGWRADGIARTKGYPGSAKNNLPKATVQSWIREKPRSEGTCGRAPSSHYDYF